MSYVRIVSKRQGGKAAHAGEVVIDVDRSHPVLGNRHHLRDWRNDAERAEVVNRHNQDLLADIAAHGPMYKALLQMADRLRSGENLALRCWCAPKPCHAENYRRELEKMLGRSLLPGDETKPQQNLF